MFSVGGECRRNDGAILFLKNEVFRASEFERLIRRIIKWSPVKKWSAQTHRHNNSSSQQVGIAEY